MDETNQGRQEAAPHQPPEYRRGFREGYRWALDHRDRGPEFLFQEERRTRAERTETVRAGDPALHVEGRQQGLVVAIREEFGSEVYTRLFEDWQRSQ